MQLENTYPESFHRSIQPADFVRKEMEATLGIFELDPKSFKEQQARVIRKLEGIYIDVRNEKDWIDNHYSYRVKLLIVATAGAIFGIIFLSMVEWTYNPLYILTKSDLSFASVLLIVPTVAFIAYARIMRAGYQDKKENETALTWVISANHVLETFVDVYGIRHRLSEKTNEGEGELVENLKRESAQKDENNQSRARKADRERTLAELERSRPLDVQYGGQTSSSSNTVP